MAEDPPREAIAKAEHCSIGGRGSAGITTRATSPVGQQHVRPLPGRWRLI